MSTGPILTGRIVLADETGGALAAIQGNVDRTFREIGDSAEQAQRRVSASMTDVVKGISGVATSALALYSAWDRVADMQVSVDRANLQVKTSLNAVEDAQRRYNAAVEKYGSDSEQARAAAADLRLAQERYQVAVERAEMMQGNLNETIVRSALSVIPTMITMVGSLSTLKQSWTVITGALTVAQHGLNAAMSANPIGIVVAAVAALVGALVMAYQTCEPFRNAINAIGAAIYDFVKPAFDAVIGALKWLWDLLTNNPIASFFRSLLGIGEGAAAAAQEIQTLNASVEAAAKNVSILTVTQDKYLAGVEEAVKGEQDVAAEILRHTSMLTSLNVATAVTTQTTTQLTEAEYAQAAAARAAAEAERQRIEAMNREQASLLQDLQRRSSEAAAIIDFIRKYGASALEAGTRKYAQEVLGIDVAGMIAREQAEASKKTVPTYTVEEEWNYNPLAMQGGGSGVVTKPTLFLAGEAGPEYVSFTPLSQGTLWPAVTVNGPLVIIEGNADRETAELAARLVEERLRGVLVEASSSQAPATSKRIRLSTRVGGV